MKVKIINRDYTMLLSGQLISNFGNIFHSIALMWIIYEVLETSSKVGLLFGLSTIPAIIIYPFAGSLVDMFNRKYLLFFCDFTAGINALILAVLAHYELLSFFNLLIILSFESILFSLLITTQSSLTQNLVQKSEYMKANSIQNLLRNLAQVSLPMIGAFLIAQFSSGLCFFINALTFFAASFFTLNIKTYIYEHDKVNDFLEKFKAGINYLKYNFYIVKFIIFFSIYNFIVFSTTLLIRILIDQKDLGVKIFGGYETIVALGSITIAFFITRLKNEDNDASMIKKIKLIMSLGLFCKTMAFFFFSFFPGKSGVFSGALFNGLGSPLLGVMFFAYLQRGIKKSYYGRVISIVFFLSEVTKPLSYSFFGYLADKISINLVLLIDSIGLLTLTLVFCLLFNLKITSINPRRVVKNI